MALPASAFSGAIVATALVLAMAGAHGRGLDTRVLLLSGVVIGAFFNAIILLIINFADVETFRAALLWTMPHPAVTKATTRQSCIWAPVRGEISC